MPEFIRPDHWDGNPAADRTRELKSMELFQHAMRSRLTGFKQMPEGHLFDAKFYAGDRVHHRSEIKHMRNNMLRHNHVTIDKMKLDNLWELHLDGLAIGLLVRWFDNMGWLILGNKKKPSGWKPSAYVVKTGPSKGKKRTSYFIPLGCFDPLNPPLDPGGIWDDHNPELYKIEDVA